MTFFHRPRHIPAPRQHAFARGTFAMASERLAGLQHDTKIRDLWIAEAHYAPDTRKQQIVVTLQGLRSAQHEIARLAQQYRETF